MLWFQYNEEGLKQDRKYLMKLKYLKRLNELLLLYNSKLENQVSEIIILIERDAKNNKG